MGSPDYIVDIPGLAQGSSSAASAGQPPKGQPWLAVRWRCCAVYSRVYRNRDATAYEGRCPRCGRPVRATIGPGGTSERFFEAG